MYINNLPLVFTFNDLQRFFGQVSNFSATFGKELIATLTEDQKVASFFQALSLELDGKRSVKLLAHF